MEEHHTEQAPAAHRCLPRVGRSNSAVESFLLNSDYCEFVLSFLLKLFPQIRVFIYHSRSYKER